MLGLAWISTARLSIENYHAYNCLISVPSTLTFRFHSAITIPILSISISLSLSLSLSLYLSISLSLSLSANVRHDRTPHRHSAFQRTCPNHPLPILKLILKRRTCPSYPRPFHGICDDCLRNPILDPPSPINYIHVAIVTISRFRAWPNEPLHARSTDPTPLSSLSLLTFPPFFSFSSSPPLCLSFSLSLSLSFAPFSLAGIFFVFHSISSSSSILHFHTPYYTQTHTRARAVI